MKMRINHRNIVSASPTTTSIAFVIITLIRFGCVFAGPSPRDTGINDRIITTPCKVTYGRTNRLYEDRVSQDKPLVFSFHVDKKYIQRSHTTNLRVEVGTTQNASLQFPILFAVRQQKYITTLEVPSLLEEDDTDIFEIKRKPSSSPPSNKAFYTAARNLCIDGSHDDPKGGRNVTVRVSTQSWSPVPFYLVLRLSDDFQLPIEKEFSFEVSPSTPKYFGFSFARPDISQVRIRASSPSSTCMTISVQTVQCPIYDLEHNVRYKGLWQTMSTTAAMTVQKMGWFEEGFILVFVAHSNSKVCGRKEDIFSTSLNNKTKRVQDHWNDFSLFSANQVDPRSKTVKLIITNESKLSDWILTLCLAIPVLVTFLISFIVLFLFRNRHEWMAKILNEKFESKACTESFIPEPELETEDESSASFSVAQSNGNERNGIARNANALRRHSRQLPDKGSGIKWKSDLCIANFRCKGFDEVEKFSKRFYWTILIVAIFYMIPVYQLVIHYLRVLYRTGEYDICYYNYLCAQRLGVMIDFNHFWSNASYVIFGILFICIVRQRSLNLCLPHQQKIPKKLASEDDDDEGTCCKCCPRKRDTGAKRPVWVCGYRFTKVCFRWDHGVPGHFGVFYALGVALTIEGFLSAAYHLCPNQSTFQFDTCFMYVIAVLLLLKIYQFRHPIHFGANQTFAILAGFVVVSVIGLLFERGTKKAVLIFKCVFVVFQYLIMILLCVYYYAVGYVTGENNKKVTDWSIFKHLGQLRSRKINGDRLILPLISFTICIAVLVYSELEDIGFASYLLYILVGNVLGTTLYYVGIMKPLHGEFKNRTWVQPTLYFLASGVIGGWSLQYFVRAPAQWELSASASRAENEDCLSGWFPFHPFYDSHDAWHFLSATALFLAFMGLLIVDDDLITTPQTEIPVF